MSNIKEKIVAIVGTTASGKTGLGVYLARKYNGEIISADSRQVYKGMDIGTGKDLDEYIVETHCNASLQYIPYHLIDVVSPKAEFNLAKFQKQANKAIKDIWSRGKLPIIVGGTGLYVQAVVDGFKLPFGKPNRGLREKLEKKTVEQLFNQLKQLDREKAISLNNSDKNNKRRLIRYIEITKQRNTKKGVKHPIGCLRPKRHNCLIFGLTYPKEVLHERIYKRLIERLEKEDMVGEVERLHKEGVSWKRLIDFGLEYKYISLYLKGELNYDDMVDELARAIRRFAKRQMTWLRRWERQGAEINWVKRKKEAANLVINFTIKF